MPISTIITNSIADDAVTVPKVTDQVLTHRNLIINGAMQVAQRGTSAVTLGTTGQTFRADRFQVEQGSVTANNGTIEVATDAPTGFEYSTKVTAGSSVTFNSTGFSALNYRIEGQDVKQLASGTSSPKSATLSFYVKSSVTGTYSLNITKYDGSTERFYVKTYTINSANTWEYKTVTVENESSYSASEWMRIYWQLGGDSGAYTATAGTFVNSNGAKRGTSAQPDMISTSGATFLLTGVQFELGEQATPFEHRSYGDELLRCYRYFEKGGIVFANQTVVSGSYAVTKRTAPTMVRTSNIYSASEAGTFAPSNEYVYHVYSGSTYLGGNWTADAEL